MRWRVVVGHLGHVLEIFALSLLAPALVALIMEPGAHALLGLAVPTNTLVFGGTALATLGAGRVLRITGRGADLRAAEAYVLVGLGWLACTAVAAVPYMVNGVLTHPVDALYEAMSGLTTTGYSVITIPLESVDPSIHFWRAETQWIGGMGIIVLTVAVLGRLATSGAQLMRAEVPGGREQRIRPGITSTAKTLWVVYAGITAGAVALLSVVLVVDVGLSPGAALFEGTFHAFTAIATGGFGTRSASVQAFSSPMFEGAVLLAMLVGGTNFALHFHVLSGRPRRALADEEFRFYLTLLAVTSSIVVAALFLTPGRAVLWDELGGKNLAAAVRVGVFQVVSASVNAGFTTAHYEHWPEAARFALLATMFVGGCVGSTGGAIKVARVLVLFKLSRATIRSILHPRAVIAIKLSGEIVRNKMVHRLAVFVFMYITFFVLGTALFIALAPFTVVEAASWSAGSLGNVGASFGGLSPDFSYGAVPVGAKIVSATLMWLGRLELFAVFVLFARETYR